MTRLIERRRFTPPADVAAQANVTAEVYAEAAADPIAFWERAATRLRWDTPWHTALDWRPPSPSEAETIPEARWFSGGRLNAAVNCVDRHVDAGHGDKVAFHVEGERGDRSSVSYRQLQEKVAQAAHALTGLGVEPGDRVVVYLPVLLETVVVALACARIGAVHSLVFGGFSAEALRFRLEDTQARVLVTSDGQFRRGEAVPVKSIADDAAAGLAHVRHVLVVRRTGDDVPWDDERDRWWHDVVDTAPTTHDAQSFDAEHPLFIIYTSGTTGRPKGLVHTTGGYLTQASWTHWALFDAKAEDVHWCTADLAWVTAHTYVLYGPLSNGMTQVIYEGTPDTPHRERHLEIIERYGVTVYYTAPTLIRTFMTWFGRDLPAGHDLSSIRLLGTVGEAINPEAWIWFRRAFGRDAVPVVDTWWQSETGAAMVAPLPGATVTKPGSATRAIPGVDAAVVDDRGAPVSRGESGTLVIRRPWPGMARTIWGDPQRYRDTYWGRFAGLGEHGGYYLAGDGATVDADGDIWILGRLDDVVNVSGHRLSTIEIESALVAHPGVGEAGTTAVPDPVTGHAVAAFVVPSGVGGAEPEELRRHVAHQIGPIARPRHVHIVPELPKTRSGKILRRLLAELWHGETLRRAGHPLPPLGDVTSLQNPWAIDQIREVLADQPLPGPLAKESTHV